MTSTSPAPAVYTGRSTAWPMVVVSSVGGVAVLAMAGWSGGPWWGFVVPMALAGLSIMVNVLTAADVRATAGPNGFTIHWGILGWPRCHYRLDRIARAEVIDLPWWRVSFGFWWTPRRTCCTLRSGPTVRLQLRNGRCVTVTVPDPHAAVAAIVEAQHAAGG